LEFLVYLSEWVGRGLAFALTYQEHGPELLRELGISEAEIERLISSGVLKIDSTQS
jgi:hypothetical protein